MSASSFHRLLQSFRPTPAAGAVPVAVQRIQLDLLLQKTGALRLLSPIPFAAPLALIFHARWGSPLALAWLALFAAVSISCFVARHRLERRQPLADDAIAPALRRSHRNILLLGLMWGLAPWMLDPHGDLAYLLMTSVFVVAAVALGSMLVASHRQTIAAMLGLCSALAWFGGVVGWVLAASSLLFLLMALDWIRQQQALLQQSLVVRFEKEDLARRLEQQVELVREANREKTRFFASASHDLRQPLHAISLFTSTLQRTALPADGVETVEQLAQSVQALSHSLETMLDVSRLDAGAVQPRLRSVGVHALFVSLQNTFAGRAEEKGLHLRLRSPGDLHVASDPLLIERLVGNLVDNAIKYTHAGGVLVAARAADVSGRAGHIRIDVVDTGQGIPAEEHRRVFEEFYQVGNPQRDRGSGLGIGLSIVKRLSELLAHPVRLQSRPGRGTRVQVWVPQAHAAPSARSEGDAAAETVAAPALPAHVLVLDDEAASRQAMAALLASHGCRVSTAGGIAEAEALLHGARFDAAIVDYRLPGARNGLDYLLDLREQSPRLRTLLVTGETAPRRMAAIHASGVPFLHKPVRAQQLLEALASPREPHGEKT